MDCVKKHPRLIALWLTLCAMLVVAMVAVGGYTRLSGSGLSITEWKPIHGTIPPLNQSEWQEEFAKYRQIPQYREINAGMTLSEFKTIFWPEYSHRVLGRLIGLVFALPLAFFWLGGFISHRFGLKLTTIFALGGAQGFMGWYMVSSGLIENTYVSHFRLSAHLALALLLLGLLVWQILNIESRKKSLTTHHLPLATYTFWFSLLCLQILYGAFTAGLHAGLMYNTWPDMNGQMLPDGIFALTPRWINLFENHAAVQLIHRTLAVIVAGGFGFWWFLAHAYDKTHALHKHAIAIACVIAFQFLLGVLTLIHAVPLALGLAHQMTAVLLFILAVTMLHRMRRT